VRAQLAAPGTSLNWGGGRAASAIAKAYPTAHSGRAPLRAPRPCGDFPGPRSQPVCYAWFETTPRLAVLSMRFGTNADWLRAGAFQRVLFSDREAAPNSRRA